MLVSAAPKETPSQIQVYNCFANALTTSAYCLATGRAGNHLGFASFPYTLHMSCGKTSTHNTMFVTMQPWQAGGRWQFWPWGSLCKSVVEMVSASQGMSLRCLGPLMGCCWLCLPRWGPLPAFRSHMHAESYLTHSIAILASRHHACVPRSLHVVSSPAVTCQTSQSVHVQQDGPMHVFLAALPAVCAVRDCSIAALTNLREVTITDFSTGAGSKLRCPVMVEPAFLALGTHHLAVGLDCKVC